MSERKTIFSEDRVYRYTLWREFYPIHALPGFGIKVEGNEAHHYVVFIGLNPSTADEEKDDPTIRRCIAFVKAWGFGALCMTNLFAFRATQPKVMKAASNPVGPDNQHHLLSVASNAGLVVAAWGKHGKHRQQDLTVNQWMTGIGVKLHCLGTNDDGSPEHPLYLPKDRKPQPWTP